MISLGARWKRAGRAQNVAPMLKQFRLAVGRSMYWAAREQQTASQPPIRLSVTDDTGDRGKPTPPSFAVAGQYCTHFGNCGVWMFKTDHNL